ncbi:hypothetical protein PIB30_032218 [Stylosanthes scabra]|uniref:Uncharacterized protein n=1 Tax=Stylosanthes scabra TaxID=79078 RepID=A0ABU6TCU2_9FABA|nr:hypothetical protein [Stylosanthes scabra]
MAAYNPLWRSAYETIPARTDLIHLCSPEIPIYPINISTVGKIRRRGLWCVVGEEGSAAM